jgi:hypothetical protein
MRAENIANPSMRDRGLTYRALDNIFLSQTAVTVPPVSSMARVVAKPAA